MTETTRILGFPISEAIVLAGLSVAGTAAAVMFEIGFCGFHGIPISLIQLSAARIVSFILVLALLISYCYHFVRLPVVYMKSSSLNERVFGLSLTVMVVPFVFFVFLILPALIFDSIFLVLLTYIVLAGLHALFVPARSLVGEMETQERRDTLAYFKGVLAQMSVSAAPVVFFVFVAAFYLAGYWHAKYFAASYFDASNSRHKLVVVYGGNWIFRDIDVATGAWQNRIKVASGSQVEDVVLTVSPVAIDLNRPDDDQGARMGEPDPVAGGKEVPAKEPDGS